MAVRTSVAEVGSGRPEGAGPSGGAAASRVRPPAIRSLTELTDEELVCLVRSGQSGAAEQLLTRYRGLVEGKARAFFLSGADRDDVVQEGMIGLYKAMRDYRPERMVRFRAFAEICVTRQIISAVKSATRQKHLPLNRSVPLSRPDGDEAATLIESLEPEPEVACLGRSLAEYLDRFGAAELSAMEIHVIRRRMEGRSYQEVAAELHCPPKAVDNALQRAKRKIGRGISRLARETPGPPPGSSPR